MQLDCKLDGSMFLPRAIADACHSAAEQFPVLLLTGPRQIGKTL